MVYRPLRKCFKNPPQKKIHDKTVQSNILWLNLNKIDKKYFTISRQTRYNPSFHCHAPGLKRRYPCTQTASDVQK